MSKPDRLAGGIALFNAGRFAEAAAVFKACAREGGGAEVLFYLNKTLQALKTPVASASAPAGLPPELCQGLRNLFDAADYPAAFAGAESLMKADPCGGYRLLRDLWLDRRFPGLERADPGSPWTSFFAASNAWKDGADARGLELLARAGAGPHPWMRYYAAEVLLRRLDLYDLARREIDAVIERCPWLWEASCLKAEILLASGAPRPLAGLKRPSPPASSQASYLAWRGAIQLWSGRYADAEKDLDRAESLDNPDALCWRGGARLMQGRLQSALEDLDRRLAIDADDPEALVWRGELHRKAKRLPEALIDLDRALRLSDDSIWARVNRGLCLLERQDAAGAAAELARLAPPRYEDVPDRGAPLPARERMGAAQDPGRHGYAVLDLKPERLRGLFLEALDAADGCRRFDKHLNAAWMRRAKVPLPDRLTPQSRLLYWLRAKGLPTPKELPFGPATVTKAQARALLRGRPT